MRKKFKYIKIGFVVGLFFCVLSSCTGFLEVKPDKSLVVPRTVRDLRALLDNVTVTNGFPSGIGEASADNYYLTDATFNEMADPGRNMYAWGEELFFDDLNNPWINHYKVIYNANMIEESFTAKPELAAEVGADDLLGAAFFYRALNYFKLITLFAVSYDAQTAGTDLGVPLRLTTDFNVPSVRATVEDVYAKIVDDLLKAVSLMDERPIHLFRPSKLASYALLSRVYLAQKKYEDAGEAAKSALDISSNLIDYNNINTAATFPFAPFNEEVIFNLAGQLIPITYVRAKMDTTLLKMYADHDLRKKAYFLKNTDQVSYRFKGSYFGSRGQFFGLANDELYVTYAECLARTNRPTEAAVWINKLLINRLETAAFTEVLPDDNILDIILDERRKELVMRDTRWEDIKRLNSEGRNIIVQRHINGERLVLAPNDARYALPFPRDVIDITGMPQNKR